MIRKYSDLLAGIVFLLFSVIMFLASLKIQRLTITKIGSDFFPKLVAILIFVFSIMLIFNSVKKLNTTKSDKLTLSKHKRSLGIIAMMFGYVFLLNVIGFIVLTSIYLFVHFYLFSKHSKRDLLLYAGLSVLITFAVYFFFNNVLHLILPSGILV